MIELATDHPEYLVPYAKSGGGLFDFGASVTVSPKALIRSGLFKRDRVWMSNRLIECGCGCTSTNTVRVHVGYWSTTMDCGKQYVEYIECSSCHEPLEFYDNEDWQFDEHLLESKEEKALQGGPEARLKAWIYAIISVVASAALIIYVIRSAPNTAYQDRKQPVPRQTSSGPSPH